MAHVGGMFEATRRHVALDRMVVIAVGDGKETERQITPWVSVRGLSEPGWQGAEVAARP